MRVWIEIAVAVVLALIFRDRILFALIALFMPKTWLKEGFRRAMGKRWEE